MAATRIAAVGANRRLAAVLPAHDSKQHRRKRFVAFSLVTHAFNLLCLALIVMQGWLRPSWLVAFTVFALGGVATFYLVIHRGWNLRLRDPSLVFAQLVFGISLAFATMSQMESPIARGLFALSGMVSISYAASTLDRRDLLALMGISSLEAILMTVHVLWRGPMDEGMRTAELVLLVVLLGVALQVCLYGSVQAALRAKIRERTASLDRAMQELRLANAALASERDAATNRASRDELTGLFNRRHLESELAVQIARSNRRNTPLTVALLDVDHFKRINDLFGHTAGDEALRHVADVMIRNIRSGDVLGRYGGEEFLLIMPDTVEESAAVLCNRLRDAVRASRPDGISDTRPITLSGGLAQHRNGENREELIQRADVALYRAKAEGRDRIVTG
jgi:diguanylate cyclase (GGDEF)-like protein